MIRSGLLLLLLSSMVFLSSCSSEPARKRGSFQRNPQVFYQLKDYSLLLSLLSSKREFYAGDEQTVLTFSLKNTGVRPVTIYEWHTFEAGNINLYYREGRADEIAPPESWKLSRSYDPDKVNLKARSPLTLNPGSNQALIQIPATFLKTLKPKAKKTPYTLRAVLNLYSVKVESEPTEIYIK